MEGSTLQCPFCGAPHDAGQQGRFCDACGLSIAPRARIEIKKSAEGPKPMCTECGSPLRNNRCVSCGAPGRSQE